MVAVALYAAPAGLLLIGLLAGVIRLGWVRSRAEVIEDFSWLSALAAAQKRLGLKHGTALLASDELVSPVSWGALRPIIIVNRAATVDSARAEVIIAHELAHVARLDWLSLLMGRLAACLFWFNPLVWILVRQSHQLCEEAADDAVLRAQVGRVEYAGVLLNEVRHANTAYLPANGVAPSRSSLTRRIAHVLDTTRPRGAPQRAWIASALMLAAGMNLAIASAEPVLARSQGVQFAAGAGERAAARLERLQSTQAKRIAHAIRSEDWEGRRGAGDTRFQDAAAVAPLVEALRDPRPSVRRIALWGLAEMGTLPRPEAERPVLQLLKDPAPTVRAMAVRTLGDFGAAATANAASELLRDREAMVRLEAAHALGDLQSPSTRPALEAALSDPDLRVRTKAAWALRQVAETEGILKRYPAS
jgi:hypothetical protein